jgi:hypothetical protein
LEINSNEFTSYYLGVITTSKEKTMLLGTETEKLIVLNCNLLSRIMAKLENGKNFIREVILCRLGIGTREHVN